jgi:hypothetical protein
MRTYTQHKLTDAQLRRLSALVNETKGAATAGMAARGSPSIQADTHSIR